MMLRRRGIASTMYLGVVRTPFESHAWLRVGEMDVTGGAQVDRYAVLATFADAGRS
jgi:acyl CoA:acetate/3-ketoacid CoA transferase beta subunit